MSLNYDTINALVRDKYIPELIDNIFDSNVLTALLLKNSVKEDGGKRIITELEYGKNTNAQGFYSGFDRLSLVPSDPITAAVWEWKQAYGAISISGLEEKQAGGSGNAVLNLIESKVGNARRSLMDMFGTTLYQNEEPTGKEFTSLVGVTVEADDDDGILGRTDYTFDYSSVAGGLYAASILAAADNCIIAADRTLGGITTTSTVNNWWHPQVGTFSTIATTKTAAATFADLLAPIGTYGGLAAMLVKMHQAYNAVSGDGDEPDLIITTPTIFAAYESAVGDKQTINTPPNPDMAKLGFANHRFKRAVVYQDQHCPAGMMFFLNTKYLKFVVHTDRNFAYEPFAKPTDQDAMTAKLLWMGNLTCSNVRRQGLLVGGPSTF